MLTWNEATEKFAQTLPGFQRRENQDNLAVRIEGAFSNRNHLFAQAGCGTGKSFAALIPAIKRATDSGLPVIYSTGTKALQDQLATKDLPFLQDNLYPNEKNLFTVLKGRSNYVCLQKVDELEDQAFKTQVLRVTDSEGFDGEIDSLKVEMTAQEKGMLSTTSDECPGKSECPFGKVCLSELAKERAKTSKVVVVNHAVLAADLSIKKAQFLMGVPEHKITGLLPHFGGVVVDEAHKMADFVTNSLGGEVTSGSYARIASLVNKLTNDRHAGDDMTRSADSLFGLVNKTLANRQDKRSKTVVMDATVQAKLMEKMVELVEALVVLSDKVTAFTIHGDDKKGQQKKRLVRRIDNAGNKLEALIFANDDQLVRWLEMGEGRKGDTINWAPLSIADFLREELLSVAPVVFTSATIKVGEDFDFLAKQVGAEKYETFDAGTPFDFQKQARILIPQIAAPVGQTVNQWRAGAIATMIELVKASNGRALLLFTSKTEMDEAYMAISPYIQAMGHRALKQGDGTSRELKEIFDADEHSVLFGMETFMTGIDIQGDSLRLLVINKLPFTNPSDVVFDARCKVLDRMFGKWKPQGGFNGLSIPTMILTLLQGFGRLIRTVNDQGLVAILDSRLYGNEAKPYGKIAMGALPDAPVLTKVSDAVDYLKSLETV